MRAKVYNHAQPGKIHTRTSTHKFWFQMQETSDKINYFPPAKTHNNQELVRGLLRSGPSKTFSGYLWRCRNHHLRHWSRRKRRSGDHSWSSGSWEHTELFTWMHMQPTPINYQTELMISRWMCDWVSFKKETKRITQKIHAAALFTFIPQTTRSRIPKRTTFHAHGFYFLWLVRLYSYLRCFLLVKLH